MSKSKPAPDAPQVKEIALQLLARREHSSYELRTKLLARGYADEIVAHILDDLSTDGYLSDNRFAEMAVHVRLRTQDGPLKIRSYLVLRGIEDSLITRFLPSDQEFWLDRALNLDQSNCLKRDISPQEATTREAWATRSRLLKNRGYPASIIRQVLETAIE